MSAAESQSDPMAAVMATAESNRTPEEERAERKTKLAAALRTFGRFGFDEGVAGHITARDPIDPDQFWVNPVGRSFKQMCVSDLIKVDHDGNIVTGDRPAKAKMDALKGKGDVPVLPKQFLQDPQSSTSRFARTFWWAAQVLGIRPPQLYARTDVGGGLTAVPVEPVASVAGAGVLQGLNPLDSVDHSYWQLSFLRRWPLRLAIGNVLVSLPPTK